MLLLVPAPSGHHPEAVVEQVLTRLFHVGFISPPPNTLPLHYVV